MDERVSRPFVHLHVHSNYSLLEGACRLEELVQAAVRYDMPALALTDRNALYGALSFHDQCRAAGIKPIIGMELQMCDGHTLVLLASTQDGYRNLCRLSSLLQAAPDRETALRAGVSWEDLDQHRAGLIALSGGQRGGIESYLRQNKRDLALRVARRLVDILGRDSVFLELQLSESEDESIAIQLAMLAHSVSAHCVATHDVHYIEPTGRDRYRVLMAMGGRGDHATDADLSFRSPAEMALRFSRFPAAFEQAVAIAERCDVSLGSHQLLFPDIELPAGSDPDGELRRQAQAGLVARFGAPNGAALARLEKELQVIQDLGYARFFLAVSDIVGFARRAGVPFSSRGSASSSLVVYALGISDVNPLRYDLYFERFLSRGRREAPDIDIDFCSKRRDEVIAYVSERFGHARVAMVSAHSTLRARSALREVAKALGVSPARVDALATQIPRFWHPGMRAEVRQAQADLLNTVSDARERRALEIAREVDGYPHHLAVHAGGIVIAPGPVTDWVAVQRAPKGVVITQWDAPAIERLGLLKIDLLGIRGLSVLQSAVEKVRRFRQSHFALDQIPDGDPGTGDLLGHGRTVGCFQIESAGIRDILRQLGVRDVAGIIAAISLYRPGPLRGGLKDAFVRRFVGEEAPAYLHPALEPILRETLGVVLYQEQVLRIANEVAGFSLEQADGLRRAMTKFRSASEMAQLKDAFVTGAEATSGVPAETGEHIWDLMQSFAGYGFPKAHAAGYAVVAYRCAYLKAHYPAEFMTARLAEWGGYYPQRVYLGEARRLGLTLRPPHVNHSGGEFTLEYEGSRPILWMGLDQVRDLTRQTLERTVAERERCLYTGWEDWFARVGPRQQEAENLARVGAVDDMGASRGNIVARVRALSRRSTTGSLQLSLFSEALSEGEPLAQKDRLLAEEELLGVAVSQPPLIRWEAQLTQYHPVLATQLHRYVGREVTVAGLPVTRWRHKTKSGALMCFLTLEDLEGMIEVVVFPDAYQQFAELLRGAGPFVVSGRVQNQAKSGCIKEPPAPAEASHVVVARRVVSLE